MGWSPLPRGLEPQQPRGSPSVTGLQSKDTSQSHTDGQGWVWVTPPASRTEEACCVWRPGSRAGLRPAAGPDPVRGRERETARNHRHTQVGFLGGHVKG